MFKKFICTTVLAGMLLIPSVNAFSLTNYDVMNKLEAQQGSLKPFEKMDSERNQWLEDNCYEYDWFYTSNKKRAYVQWFKLKSNPDYLIFDKVCYDEGYVLRSIKDQNGNWVGYASFKLSITNGEYKSRLEKVRCNGISRDEFSSIMTNCYDYNSID